MFNPKSNIHHYPWMMLLSFKCPFFFQAGLKGLYVFSLTSGMWSWRLPTHNHGGRLHLPFPKSWSCIRSLNFLNPEVWSWNLTKKSVLHISAWHVVALCLCRVVCEYWAGSERWRDVVPTHVVLSNWAAWPTDPHRCAGTGGRHCLRSRCCCCCCHSPATHLICLQCRPQILPQASASRECISVVLVWIVTSGFIEEFLKLFTLLAAWALDCTQRS